MNEIFPNLYIGNQEASATYGSQFDVVVNCTPDVPFARRRIGDPEGVNNISNQFIYIYLCFKNLCLTNLH